MANSSDNADASTASRRRLGELALERGVISEQQLSDALHAQDELKKLGLSERIGTILFKKKVISKQVLDDLLKEQSADGSGKTKPKRLGNFELYEKVGQGAMGVVFRARQVTMDRIVAVKILAPKYAGDASFIKRFVREARAAGQFSHENIVTALDVGFIEPYHYFVMEYVEGQTLRKLVEDRGPLPEKEALIFTLHIAKGLDHALAKNILHRDVKPENVIVTSQNIAKLLDMGLACAAGASEDDSPHASDTDKRKAAGTPHYISPEAARGEDLDTRSDLYSLGCTLYQLLSGKTPYDGTNGRSIMAKHIAEPFPDIRDKRKDLSAGTVRILEKLAAKDREDRYATPTQLIEDLEAQLEGSALRHATPAGGSGRNPRVRGQTTTGPRAPVGERGTTGPRSPVRPRGATTGPASPILGDKTGNLSPTQPGAATAKARQQQAAAGIWVAVGAGVAIVAGLALALGGGSEKKAASRPARSEPPPEKPAPVEPPRKVEVKAPAGPSREQLAREALDAAQKMAKDRAADFAALLPAFEHAAERAKDTVLAQTAAEALAGTRDRHAKALDELFASLQRTAEAFSVKNEFKAAAEVFKHEAVPEPLRAGDWMQRLDAGRQAEAGKAEAAAQKLLAEARAKAQALNMQGFEAAIALALQIEALPADLAPSVRLAGEEKQRWAAALDQLRQTEAQAQKDKLAQSREIVLVARKDIQPALQANRFTAAREALETRLRDKANEAATDLIRAEIADLDALLALRKQAVDELKKQEGAKVTLRRGNATLTGTIKAAPGGTGVGLKLAEGPEFSLGAEQLDANDVDTHAPIGPAGQERDNFKRRGLLFFAAGDFAKARECFARARDAGLPDAQFYFDKLERVEFGEAEARAKRDWAAAEERFKAQQYKEAHLQYLAFAQQHAKTKVHAEVGETLKQRLVAIDFALNPTKPGLLVSIFKGQEFKPEDLLASRVDANIDYDWGGNSPGPNLPNDGFCVRWTGSIKIEKPGRYTFATMGDDGARLWVNGQQLVNDWTIHPPQRFAGEIELAAGTYDLKVEFFEAGGGAFCKLFYALKDGFPEKVIPPEVLQHDPRQAPKPAGP